MKTKMKILLSLMVLAAITVGCSQTAETVETEAAPVSQPETQVEEAPVELTSESMEEELIEDVIESDDDDDVEDIDRPVNWSKDSHSNDVDPNYDVLFPDDEVNQINITIAPEDWALMQANLAERYGGSGTGDRKGGGGKGPDMGGQSFADEKPIWVEATIEFDGETWEHVGIRYKGNSSLQSAARSGDDKTPFKMDFDEFEDDYPEIDDQRFYGFKQLSFANAYKDATFLRDALTSDILQEAGLPAAETAFVELVIDYGEGPVSFGLYSMIEVVDDTLIENFFGDDDGNIYDADGSAAAFSANSFNQIESSFGKENNEESDWSDIEELFEILHSDLRLSDAAAWRSSLESVFDVDGFLEWLAVAAALDHWDSYGSMSHNYYLYHNPETDLITWISWDHNEVLLGRAGGRSFSIDKNDVSANWPLIRFLLDDEVYAAQYDAFLQEIINGVFEPARVVANIEEMAALIEPYASAEIGAAAFDRAVEELISQVYQQVSLVDDYLNK